MDEKHVTFYVATSGHNTAWLISHESDDDALREEASRWYYEIGRDPSDWGLALRGIPRLGAGVWKFKAFPWESPPFDDGQTETIWQLIGLPEIVLSLPHAKPYSYWGPETTGAEHVTIV